MPFVRAAKVIFLVFICLFGSNKAFPQLIKQELSDNFFNFDTYPFEIKRSDNKRGLALKPVYERKFAIEYFTKNFHYNNRLDTLLDNPWFVPPLYQKFEKWTFSLTNHFVAGVRNNVSDLFTLSGEMLAKDVKKLNVYRAGEENNHIVITVKTRDKWKWFYEGDFYNTETRIYFASPEYDELEVIFDPDNNIINFHAGNKEKKWLFNSIGHKISDDKLYDYKYVQKTEEERKAAAAEALKADEERRLALKLAEEKRIAAEKKAEEERKSLAAAIAKAEEERKALAAAIKAEEERKSFAQAEAKRENELLAELKRRREEAEAETRKAEEKKKAVMEEAKRESELLAELKRKREEAATMKTEEEKRAATAAAAAAMAEEKRRAEELAKAKAEEEKLTALAAVAKAEEKRRAEELARAKAEEERLAAAVKEEAERNAAAAKAQEEKRKAEELAKIRTEEERKAAAERAAEEERKKQLLEKLAEEEKKRIALLQAAEEERKQNALAREKEEKRLAELKAETERKAAEEAKRKAEEVAKQEAMMLAELKRKREESEAKAVAEARAKEEEKRKQEEAELQKRMEEILRQKEQERLAEEKRKEDERKALASKQEEKTKPTSEIKTEIKSHQAIKEPEQKPETLKRNLAMEIAREERYVAKAEDTKLLIPAEKSTPENIKNTTPETKTNLVSEATGEKKKSANTVSDNAILLPAPVGIKQMTLQQKIDERNKLLNYTFFKQNESYGLKTISGTVMIHPAMNHINITYPSNSELESSWIYASITFKLNGKEYEIIESDFGGPNAIKAWRKIPGEGYTGAVFYWSNTTGKYIELE